ncbi:MAG: FAD-dependent oxidoreductase, partial [Acidobacteria bacterium]|nr:FAD-dependent oxidoreductase [Acidobacteriota bacterium]
MAGKRFVIIGGGPAGNTAATQAARLGAEVTMIERDIVGGAAHLLDCIPSKAMIATGGAIAFLRRSEGMGLDQVEAQIDLDNLRDRLASIEARLENSARELLTSQGVSLLEGSGRMLDTHTVGYESVDGETRQIEADVVVLSTGSRPRIPEWANIDGERILTTRDAYPPQEMPSHLIVIG